MATVRLKVAKTKEQLTQFAQSITVRIIAGGSDIWNTTGQDAQLREFEVKLYDKAN